MKAAGIDDADITNTDEKVAFLIYFIFCSYFINNKSTECKKTDEGAFR